MSAGALIVRVPEAAALVDDLRAAHDPAAGAGVPAHVTVLHPFTVPDAAALAGVAAALAAVAAFDFVLGGVGRWPATAYLRVEPELPFVRLTRAVVARFPDWLPYGGRHDAIVPHLTVGDGDVAAAGAAERALRARLALPGSIAGRCVAVEWWIEAGGRWRAAQVLPLREPD